MTQSVAEPRYDVARKGTALGSYSLPEIASEIASGRILWSDDCWTEGMESWAKLDDIRNLIESAATKGSNKAGMTRLPTYVAIGGLGLILVGVSCYYLASPGAPESATGEPGAAPSAAVTPTISSRDRSLRLGLSEIQDKISTLAASSFLANKNENGATIYTHRYYKGIGNRIPVRVEIDSTGRCHLVSYYQGKDWMLHRQLRFVIGRLKLETEVIEPHKRSRSIGEDNSVSESCRFTSPDDAKLVARLAAASESQIILQMVGRTLSERPLSHETKLALRESQELSELLSKRGKLLEDLGARP